MLLIWKIGVFRRKQFVQKQEIFIANKISVVVKDEEKAELFKRSHTTTKRALIYKVQLTTPRSRKVGRRQNLHNFNCGAKTTTSHPVYLGCHVAVAAKENLSNGRFR